MAAGDVHTFKKGDRWVNKVEGNKPVSNSASTKKEAQRIGRRMALKRAATTSSTRRMVQWDSTIRTLSGILRGRRRARSRQPAGAPTQP